jgi:hypothetical protein
LDGGTFLALVAANVKQVVAMRQPAVRSINHARHQIVILINISINFSLTVGVNVFALCWNADLMQRHSTRMVAAAFSPVSSPELPDRSPFGMTGDAPRECSVIGDILPKPVDVRTLRLRIRRAKAR